MSNVKHNRCTSEKLIAIQQTHFVTTCGADFLRRYSNTIQYNRNSHIHTGKIFCGFLKSYTVKPGDSTVSKLFMKNSGFISHEPYLSFMDVTCCYKQSSVTEEICYNFENIQLVVVCDQSQGSCRKLKMYVKNL